MRPVSYYNEDDGDDVNKDDHHYDNDADDDGVDGVNDDDDEYGSLTYMVASEITCNPSLPTCPDIAKLLRRTICR